MNHLFQKRKLLGENTWMVLYLTMLIKNKLETFKSILINERKVMFYLTAVFQLLNMLQDTTTAYYIIMRQKKNNFG